VTGRDHDRRGLGWGRDGGRRRCLRRPRRRCWRLRSGGKRQAADRDQPHQADPCGVACPHEGPASG
jgi:hypothetical protein